AGGVLDARQAAQTIGYKAAPSMIAALQARSDLADADANVANYLVGSGDKNIQAAQDLRADVGDAIDRMLTGAENIAFADAERQSLKAMHLALSAYLENW